ncbi:MAG: ATP-binding cassette domain-containing protein [Gemmatimonadota bacterium]
MSWASENRSPENDGNPHIAVRDLTMAFGDFVVMRDLNFEIERGDVFVIMGGSGCGKSTLLRHMLGFLEPAKGSIWFGDQNFTEAGPEARASLMRRAGVLFQGGALWSSMTLRENISLPLEQYTELSPEEIDALVSFKLSLVGLAGFEDYYPSEISGGMQKRAGLARAIALDPEILFFDEPSAGLDPLSARRLDELIIELSESLGTTIVLVTHELASIFTVATNSVFLDVETRTQGDVGDPRRLRDHSESKTVRRFLNRGDDSDAPSPSSRPREGTSS